MRNLFNFLILALVALSLSSCNESAAERLKRSAETSQAQCPIDLGDEIAITSITYDGANLTYVIEGPDEKMPLALPPEFNAVRKERLESALKQSNEGPIKECLDLCRESSSNIVIVLRGQVTGLSETFIIPHTDL